MKVWKTIAFLFLYPVLLLGTGFLGGALFVNHFYPGHTREAEKLIEYIPIDSSVKNDGDVALEESQEEIIEKETVHLIENASVESVQEAALQEETLNADTSYILEETDLRTNSVVETRWSLPVKYIGMDRQAFLEAMEVYEAAPPLEELERGFVSLEVLRFSTDEVVVQMNYEYVQPTVSFYLVVRDNYVAVCLEDMQTVYMETDILLKELPEELQQEIIQVMYVPDEETLFDFLENYSS